MGTKLDLAIYKQIDAAAKARGQAEAPEHLAVGQRAFVAEQNFLEAVPQQIVIKAVASLYHNGQIGEIITGEVKRQLDEMQKNKSLIGSIKSFLAKTFLGSALDVFEEFRSPPATPFIVIKQPKITPIEAKYYRLPNDEDGKPAPGSRSGERDAEKFFQADNQFTVILTNKEGLRSRV